MTNTSRYMAGNKMFYDAVVSADGDGDYTSLVTALSTEGASKSIFMKRGNYTETSNAVSGANTSIYFDDPTITFNGAELQLAGDNSAAYGKVNLTGTGTALNRRLFHAIGNDSHFENLLISITSVGDGLTKGSGANMNIMSTTVNRSSVRVHVNSVTYNAVGATATVLFNISTGNSGFFTFSADTIVQTPDVLTIGVGGNNDDFYKVIINSITTTAGSNGIGARFISGRDNNTMIGVVKNCDSANFSDAGAGNNTALLNSA